MIQPIILFTHFIINAQKELIGKYISSDVGAAKSLAEPGYTRDQQGNTKVVMFHFGKCADLNFGKCAILNFGK